jgi:hypothetical protein
MCTHEGKHVLLKGKRKIICVKGVANEVEVYNGYKEMACFGADINLSIFDEGEEATYVLAWS